MPFVYKLYDNVADVLKATAEQKQRALEAVGIQAEGGVKDEITDLDAVVPDACVEALPIRWTAIPSRSAQTSIMPSTSTREPANTPSAAERQRNAGYTAIPWTGEFRMGFPQKPQRFIKNAMERFAKDYIEIIKEYLKK